MRLPVDAPVTSAFGLFLNVTAHYGGWPVVEGGSAEVISSLVRALSDADVSVQVDRPIRQLGDLPRSRVTLFDTSAWGLVDIAGERLSARYKSGVTRFGVWLSTLRKLIGWAGRASSILSPSPLTQTWWLRHSGMTR